MSSPLLLFSCSVTSNSLHPHGLQHSSLACPSPTQEFAQTHVHWVSDAIQWCLCRPLLLLASIFPSIRVFSNEPALHMRWPKYWSFSFNISPSDEYSGLISFRIDRFDFLTSLRDSQKSSPTPQFKSINSLTFSFLYSPTLTFVT